MHRFRFDDTRTAPAPAPDGTGTVATDRSGPRSNAVERRLPHRPLVDRPAGAPTRYPPLIRCDGRRRAEQGPERSSTPPVGRDSSVPPSRRGHEALNSRWRRSPLGPDGTPPWCRRVPVLGAAVARIERISFASVRWDEHRLLTDCSASLWSGSKGACSDGRLLLSYWLPAVTSRRADCKPRDSGRAAVQRRSRATNSDGRACHPYSPD